jgi:murein DD-endopeptidase MepM/ murein hydrolase activator NlpD
MATSAVRYVTTGYNHASRYIVHVGQRVREGQVVGYVGTTGFSTGCHLHLMVWINGRLRNPMTVVLDANPVVCWTLAEGRRS